jgi:hypothetical protein
LNDTDRAEIASDIAIADQLMKFNVSKAKDVATALATRKAGVLARANFIAYTLLFLVTVGGLFGMGQQLVQYQAQTQQAARDRQRDLAEIASITLKDCMHRQQDNVILTQLVSSLQTIELLVPQETIKTARRAAYQKVLSYFTEYGADPCPSPDFPAKVLAPVKAKK